jgi:hypothetical protein
MAILEDKDFLGCYFLFSGRQVIKLRMQAGRQLPRNVDIGYIYEITRHNIT